MTILEAVDHIAHTGQTELRLHTWGRHGGRAEGIVMEPTGMVLVLAADMIRGVLHLSRLRHAHPQWTIQVYTPPRAGPFSTWAILAIMSHLASEGTPAASVEDIAKDLRASQAGQDFPWHRPRDDFPVASAVEGLSLGATLQPHHDKMARPFL